MAVHSLEDPRAFDLARLKHHVAVRENDRRPRCAEPLDYVEGVGIKRMFAPVMLKCAEIISIAQLSEELFGIAQYRSRQAAPNSRSRWRFRSFECGRCPVAYCRRRLEKRVGWGS